MINGAWKYIWLRIKRRWWYIPFFGAMIYFSLNTEVARSGVKSARGTVELFLGLLIVLLLWPWKNRRGDWEDEEPKRSE